MSDPEDESFAVVSVVGPKAPLIGGKLCRDGSIGILSREVAELDRYFFIVPTELVRLSKIRPDGDALTVVNCNSLEEAAKTAECDIEQRRAVQLRTKVRERAKARKGKGAVR